MGAGTSIRCGDRWDEETVQVLRRDSWRMDCLRAAAGLGLHDWYLAAGFVRNAVWDHLHRREVRTPLNDIDLVFYDPANLSRETEEEIDRRLRSAVPEAPWEVCNQARMHRKHGDPPYADAADAIAHWVEIPTCVGVRLQDGELVFAAPFGLEHNWSLRVEPNPRRRPPAAVYNGRIQDKQWTALWPNLRISWL